MKTILFEGRLFPGDGAVGCKFRVEERKGKVLRIVLFSPYGSEEIVDEGIITVESIGQWLIDRLDF